MSEREREKRKENKRRHRETCAFFFWHSNSTSWHITPTMAATAPLSAPEKRRGVRREDEKRERVVGERMRGKTNSLPLTLTHSGKLTHTSTQRQEEPPHL